MLWGLGTFSLLPFRSRPALRPSLPQLLPLPRAASSSAGCFSSAGCSSAASSAASSPSFGGLLALLLGLDHLGLGLAHRHPLGVDRLGLILGDHELVLDPPAPLGDPGALADLLAQVVELRPADIAARRHLKLLDLRRVQREGPLDPDSEGVLAHGEGLAGAAALALDHYPLEHLGPAAVALDDLEVDADPVARAEAGALPQNALLEALDHCAHWCKGVRKREKGAVRGRAAARTVAEKCA